MSVYVSCQKQFVLLFKRKMSCLTKRLIVMTSNMVIYYNVTAINYQLLLLPMTGVLTILISQP